MVFTDRADAGRRLAAALRHVKAEQPVVLGLPRGGVPVASQVARALGAPLDVIVVRKLGVPHHRELAFGAIGEGGVRVINEDVVRRARLDRDVIEPIATAEEAKLDQQARRFREGRPRLPLEGRTAVVVDDGIATGATASAACQVVRAQGAARVVLAVPVAPPEAADRVHAGADDLVCVSSPIGFSSVGEWYEDFSQTSDEEVVSLLEEATDTAASGDPAAGRPTSGGPARSTEVEVDAGGIPLDGDLTLPEGARAIVMFAHGSGSSRHSPRNRQVAAALNEEGLGTLLFDLLTPDEESDRANVFDIAALSRRLADATHWLRGRRSLPIGYFGASTGAAAALRAAASADTDVAAVVSRGGRPDLAGDALSDVRAPTLLIVGGADSTVLDLNRRAQAQLRCENGLEVIPGATHLFEEPGALEDVAELARSWFTSHLLTPAG
ncbi:phosphoribosyltransferase [Streptomyces sp. NPDC051320]|uniref:phosphoribosyltransferase n=1 Tax=Streptomyces sp. NPDC051320 TaxID=3154644 RepID=UPI003413A70E